MKFSRQNLVGHGWLLTSLLQCMLAGGTSLEVSLPPGSSPVQSASLTTSCRPEDFGEIRSEITDARPFIQQALDAMAAAGGGEVILSGKTYLLGSFQPDGEASYTILTPRSRVCIRGVGPASVLKVGAGLRTRTRGLGVLYGHSAYLEDCSFADFTVDFNGTGNPNPWNTTASNVNRMGCSSGARNLFFRNLTFRNAAGAHFLWISNSERSSQPCEQVHIEHCTFQACGQALLGNQCSDHSSVFLDARFSEVTGCSFVQPNLLDQTSTAIEIHESGVTVTANQIYGYANGINLGADIKDQHDVIVLGNVLLEVGQGVALWSMKDYRVSNLVISSNTFRIRERALTLGYGITGSSTMTSTSNGSGLIISENLFKGPVPGNLPFPNQGILLQRWEDVTIRGNQFYRWNGEAIWMSALGTSPHAMRRIVVSGNTFRSCGTSTTLRDSKRVGAFLGGMTPESAIDDITLERNAIYPDAAEGGTPAAIGFDFTGKVTRGGLFDNQVLGTGMVPHRFNLPGGPSEAFVVRGPTPMP